MSCLTRKLQQNITRYLQRHNDLIVVDAPEKIKGELVNKGLCPSDVTTEQIRLIMQRAQGQ